MTSYRAARTAVVPSSLWACGPHPHDPDELWPVPVVRRAITEFTRPTAQVVLLATTPTHRTGARRAETALADLRHTVSTRALADSPASAGHGSQADLIIASLLPAPHPAHSTDLCSQVDFAASEQLRGGAVLAVLTRCTHSPTGALDDATGPVVAAAQAADLLYLSHIVAVGVRDDTIAAPPATAAAGSGPRHQVVHIDVSVFLRPDDQHAAAAALRPAA